MHIILLRHKTAAQVAENSSPFIHPGCSLPHSIASYPKKRPVGLHLLPNYCSNVLTLAETRGRAGSHLLGLRVRIPQGAWMSLVNVVCCRVQGWSLVQGTTIQCDVSECDRETSTISRPWLTKGCRLTKIYIYIPTHKRTLNPYPSLANHPLIFPPFPAGLYLSHISWQLKPQPSNNTAWKVKFLNFLNTSFSQPT